MKIITLVLGPLETNCYLVGDEATGLCTVIDPATRSTFILDKIREQGWTVGAILLTHAHFDHVGALRSLHEALPETPIFVCADDKDERYNMSHGNLVYTDLYEKSVTVGSLEFSALHTPGHTPGSVCLRVKNALFSGDTLFAASCGRTDFPGGDPEAMRQSLRTLAALPDSLQVFPGHGESTTLADEKRWNPYLREAMET